MLLWGKEEVASADVSCVPAKDFFLRESMRAFHFLRLKLKCACLILLVLFLGTLALFTGVSCSWTFHSCHESSLPLYLSLGHKETRRAGRGLCYRLWYEKYVKHTPAYSFTKDPISQSEFGRNRKGVQLWTGIYATIIFLKIDVNRILSYTSKWSTSQWLHGSIATFAVGSYCKRHGLEFCSSAWLFLWFDFNAIICIGRGH